MTRKKERLLREGKAFYCPTCLRFSYLSEGERHYEACKGDLVKVSLCRSCGSVVTEERGSTTGGHYCGH